MTEEDQAPPDETPEEVEVREHRALESLGRDAELAQLRGVLSNQDVRDVLWRVLERCHVFMQVFDGNFGKMAFNEGQRSIGLYLLSEIGQSDPKALVKMQERSAAIANEENRRREESAARRKRRP